MPDQLTRVLRFLAASLLAVSGAAYVASLWFRELDEAAIAALLLGAVYLVIAIGLFGQSRFTLFVAMAVPSAVAITSLGQHLIPAGLQGLAAPLDLTVVLLSLVVLWQVRNRPSQ